MPLRKILFWCHFTAGVCAGLVILLMSATGVLLTYERQILAWADSDFQSTVRPGVGRMPAEATLRRLRASDAGPASAITVRRDPAAPVAVAMEGRTLYLDAYTGAVLGASSPGGVRAAMSTIREWHRWLAVPDARRATGRAITGWSTLVFAAIVCSGIVLWLPRGRGWPQLRAVLFFRRGARGKARDFNWHNVAGIWSAVPLLLIILSALPISFPWANAALFQAFGEQPPPPPSRARTAARDARVDGLDRAFERATAQVEGWQSISVRLPASARGYVFTIDRGNGGQPQLRDTLTVAATGDVVAFEPFAAQTPARRARSIARFTHTGEVLGIAGQTIAGIVSGGAVLLAWTGLSLAWRRLFGGRRSREVPRAREENAA
jgi:uncharacterized iron-regulated membrane protein